jgi:glycosyltransferase involved in cell wall biosynthesis
VQRYSVLMPVYYKENPVFLRKSIDSILMQTIRPTEILIVKDGALTPELDALLDEYEKKEKSIRVLALKDNVGLGEALRIGVEQCSCGLVARMDSDDIALPGRCELQLLAFDQDHQLALVGGQILEFDGDDPQNSDRRSKRNVPTSYDEIKAFARYRNPLNHMTVMYRKEAVLAAGNYQDMPMFEDYYLWARMMVNGSRMINLDEVLVYARQGSGMYARRGGLQYVSKMVRCQKAFVSIGFLSKTQAAWNIILRSPVALVPNKLRKVFYNLFLRTK